MKKLVLPFVFFVAGFVLTITIIGMYEGYQQAKTDAATPKEATIELSVDGAITFIKVQPSTNTHIVCAEGKLIKVVDQTAR